ncbi:hypothetical protein FOL47_007446 [Perkinsus chesapeaki]|uniref:Zinc finger HIT domain-containing protein n=1 Tax=Perkinsus chesapeaki TaxID=330153 RepID=A0A7J6MW62_PERCH|nr:hypothetical protein FOL47_007446 [Perkinsus chesapeaki]
MIVIRFVCCQRRYCSISCYKEHTSKPCTGGKRRDEEQAPQRKRRKPLYDFEDAELSLYSSCSKDDLKKLRESDKVRSKLSHPTLRKIIKRIDSSDDRVAALEKQLGCDADFVAFVDECLEAVGFKYTTDDKKEEPAEPKEKGKLIEEVDSDSGDSSSESGSSSGPD